MKNQHQQRLTLKNEIMYKLKDQYKKIAQTQQEEEDLKNSFIFKAVAKQDQINPNKKNDPIIAYVRKAFLELKYYRQLYSLYGQKLTYEVISKQICQIYPIDQVIFRQDDPGNNFYIILYGVIGIYKKVQRQDKQTQESMNDEIKLTELKAGESFGEIALLKGNKGFRTATAKCESICFLASIEKDTFLQLLQNVEIQKLEESIRILQEIDIFRCCEYEILRSIYLLSKSLKFFYKQTIYEQDEDNTDIFIIVSGQVAVLESINLENDKILLKNLKQVAVLSQGEIIGHESLLGYTGKIYSVISIQNDTTLFQIHLEDIKKVFDEAKQLESLMINHFRTQNAFLQKQLKQLDGANKEKKKLNSDRNFRLRKISGNNSMPDIIIQSEIQKNKSHHESSQNLPFINYQKLKDQIDEKCKNRKEFKEQNGVLIKRLEIYSDFYAKNMKRSIQKSKVKNLTWLNSLKQFKQCQQNIQRYMKEQDNK